MSPTNRVILNTIILYAQLIIGMILGFITTRLVLDALGEINYGIYMLVAGTVSILSILNSAMSNTSMRYLAHSLGAGNRELSLKTFNSTLYLHYVIGFIVIILMEVGGWLMFEYLLNIPEDKMFDAKIVFQFMVITTFVSIISVPYDAVMNSHENIIALSSVDVLGYVLKLGVAVYLLYAKSNLLILYGFLLMLIQIIQRIIKQAYSQRKYDECKFRLRQYKNKQLTKEILSFTGWSLFGSLASLSVTQIKGILINMFFGVKLNAAEGVSNTAGNAVNQVAASMTRAINPQLMKSEGGGDRIRMLRITYASAKFSTFLLAFFGVPFIIEAKTLLNLWLKEVPEYAVIFCQLTILLMLMEKFTFQITNAIRAVGIIKSFQAFEALVLISYVPTLYIILHNGGSPVSVYVILIFFYFIVAIVRLYFGNKIAGININDYMKNVVFHLLVPLISSSIAALIPQLFCSPGFLRVCITSIIFWGMFTSIFWKAGTSSNEKYIIKSTILNIVKKLKQQPSE